MTQNVTELPHLLRLQYPEVTLLRCEHVVCTEILLLVRSRVRNAREFTWFECSLGFHHIRQNLVVPRIYLRSAFGEKGDIC